MTQPPEKESLSYKVGFSDAEIASYEVKGSTCYVRISLWNAQKIEIVFSEVAGIIDRGPKDISDIVVSSEGSQFFDEIISIAYETIPVNTGLRLYQLIGLDDFPVMEIVAKNAEISER